MGGRGTDAGERIRQNLTEDGTWCGRRGVEGCWVTGRFCHSGNFVWWLAGDLARKPAPGSRTRAGA